MTLLLQTLQTTYDGSTSVNSESQRITPFVFRCNMDTPLLVHTGSILGFSSKVPATGNVMQVQFTEQAGTVGYHRNVGLGILFNTALTSIVHVDEASGVVPLITPLDGKKLHPAVLVEHNFIKSFSAYVIGSEKEDLATLIPSPSASASTLLPNPSSFPPVWNGREGSGTSATAVLVVVPLCIVILLVLAIAGLVFAAIFFRQRRAPSITKQADGECWMTVCIQAHISEVSMEHCICMCHYIAGILPMYNYCITNCTVTASWKVLQPKKHPL